MNKIQAMKEFFKKEFIILTSKKFIFDLTKRQIVNNILIIGIENLFPYLKII